MDATKIDNSHARAAKGEAVGEEEREGREARGSTNVRLTARLDQETKGKNTTGKEWELCSGKGSGSEERGMDLGLEARCGRGREEGARMREKEA